MEQDVCGVLYTRFGRGFGLVLFIEVKTYKYPSFTRLALLFLLFSTHLSYPQRIENGFSSPPSMAED
jgi:hypothetical protein